MERRQFNTIAAAAAIANALERALGVRARHLPLTAEGIAKAMS